jgi:hypothetical protein
VDIYNSLRRNCQLLFSGMEQGNEHDSKGAMRRIYCLAFNVQLHSSRNVFYA